MRRYNRKRRREPPVRDWDPSVCRGTKGRRDARNDLERHACPRQREGLLSSATEDERVSPLQPDHAQTSLRSFDKDAIDFVLRDAVPAGGLSDIDPLRLPGRLVQQAGVDEPVVGDDVGRSQSPKTLKRDQFGIPWTRPNEHDPASLSAGIPNPFRVCVAVHDGLI